LREVACIGARQLSRIQFTVPRAGLKDYNHITEINKKICRMGAGYAMKDGKLRITPPLNMTSLTSLFTPMGGFPHYGEVKQEFIPLRSCCIGPKKRVCIPSGSLSYHKHQEEDSSRPHRTRHPS